MRYLIKFNTMDNFKSKLYLLQFNFNHADYVVPVSEVPLAKGAIAYVVKLQNYRGLFIKTGDSWSVRSQGTIPESLRNQLIKELQHYPYKQLSLIAAPKEAGVWARR